MHFLTVADADASGIKVVHQSCPQLSRRDRIIEALGAARHIPTVDEESLSRYYEYLREHLGFPFPAHYPKPTTSREEEEFRCNVLELLDPADYLGDRFDGIFCKTCKGEYELNLPLVELHVPENSFRVQLIEDYGFWLWNWR
jgi:hypothetical protein